MTRLEDRNILRIEDFNSCECPTCGEHLEFIKDGCRYTINHCDKIIMVEPKTFIAVITKNKNVKIPKPLGTQNHQIGHADPETKIKWRRYV
jgi:hypothetical protein